jgi:hypothetical protein
MNRALLLAVFALILAGCGKDDKGLLPPEEARIIEKKIDQATKTHYGGDCVTALQRAEEARQRALALEDVNPEIKKSVVRGIARFQVLVQERCDKK